MNYPIRLSLCSSLLLTTLQAAAAVSDVSRIYKSPVSLARFEVCFGGGCADSKVVGLSANEWQQVEKFFKPQAPSSLSPETERKNIAQAIGLLERLVGEKTGTAKDRAGTFDNGDIPGQMDCNDEAINTTTYIRLMQQQGLIKLHASEDLRTRNFFFTGWPHTTAVIHEVATGKRFAVDSWFYDNGAPATIVPFEDWKANYVPADSPLHATPSRP
jgi:hypothetical protein